MTEQTLLLVNIKDMGSTAFTMVKNTASHVTGAVTPTG